MKLKRQQQLQPTTEATTETTAVETTTEKKTENTTSSEATSAESEDYTGIAGYWFINGDPRTASLHITEDGKFTAYYASGLL